MTETYSDFLARKAIIDPPSGFDLIPPLPDCLLPLQAALVPWALRRGRAALFAGTGLGKSLMELAWGEAVHSETGEDIIHFAPLAVSAQLVREAEKFGIPAYLTTGDGDKGAGIPITNYQKLSHFDLSRRAGVILDESSILKSTDGHYRSELIAACQSVPYRLAATATPAPNDHMELGNHSEFLGIMSQTDMLATFFTHDSAETQKWRLKGHAQDEFWRWMASWSVMVRKPSDLGFSDEGYELPSLRYEHHVVEVAHDMAETGLLFAMDAMSLSERLSARRASKSERVAKAIEIIGEPDRPFCIWCNLNDEQDALEKHFGGKAFSVRGAMGDDLKEKAIAGWLNGERPIMISKKSIMGFGMNFQHCADTIFVGLDDSWEQFYQAVRRFWRFGQTKPVTAHVITASTEGAVLANIQRKESEADKMAEGMIRHMADLSSAAIRGSARDKPLYSPQEMISIPTWLL